MTLESTFAVRFWVFDYAIRREAHIFGPGIVFCLFLIGKSWCVVQSKVGGTGYIAFFFFEYSVNIFFFLWTSSWCVIGVENVGYFSPGFFFCILCFYCVRLIL